MEKEVSDRQKQLTEKGGLYKDWGDGVSHGNKRLKVDNVKTETVNYDAIGTRIIRGSVKIDENEIIRDFDCFDNESLCGADSEELAALANLDKKFLLDKSFPLPK